MPVMLNDKGDVKSVSTLPVLDKKSLSDCIYRNRPAVFRSAVSHWPMVASAQESFTRLSEYLSNFDKNVMMQAMLAKPQERGRIFYQPDFKNFNFQRMNGYLKDALDFLGDEKNGAGAPTFYLGSMKIADYLPGLQKECALEVLSARVEPNIWIGNRVVVPTHNDNNQNIACVAAGRRRFTLFPPAQEPNLYIAHVAKTPAGRPVSQVDLASPNLEDFPRFAQALPSAYVVELGPGDAIFIPYQWWHNVESMEDMNVLVNFWWEGDPQNPTSSDTY